MPLFNIVKKMVNYHFPPEAVFHTPNPNQQLQIDRKCFRQSDSGFSNYRAPPLAPLTRPIINHGKTAKVLMGYPSAIDGNLRPIQPGSNFVDVLGHDVEATPTSVIFLSQNNQQHLLKLICQILRRICPSQPITPEAQDTSELLALSRQIYLNQSTNSLDQREEIAKLNAIVIDYLVPRMLSGMEAHSRYLYDIDHPNPCPLIKPVKTRCYKELGGAPLPL